MTDHTITCLEDAINLVRWGSGPLSEINSNVDEYEKFFPRGTWFRGQENAKWHLVPSVFRKDDQGNMEYAQSESDILLDFKLRHPNRRAEMVDSLDWLCLMQHHGCPTRILDWTENVPTALFFAVRQSRDFDDEPGALFVLNSFKLNHCTAGEPTGPTVLRAGDLPCWVRAQLAEDTSFDSLLNTIANERPADLEQFHKDSHDRRPGMAKYYSLPVAVWPRSIHERMTRQQSVFVVHGGTYSCQADGIPEPVLLETLHERREREFKFFEKFIVPSDRKEIIRKELGYLGIHVASLFPELEYQAEYIRAACKAVITDNEKNHSEG